MASNEAIDVFCHYLPPDYCDEALKGDNGRLHMLSRARDMPVMSNVDARLAMMDAFPGYRQVLSLSSPSIEFVAPPERSPALARLANEGMAELVGQYPAQFPGFIASLPLNNGDATLEEARYAIDVLGACGVQIFSNINGNPVDQAYLMPLYGLMAEYDLPIWLHPVRGLKSPDYVSEEVSKFELWWAFGWPHESSLAMGRLVFSGVFERHPDLKIITHHVGGTIPMMEGRIRWGLQTLGTRTPEPYKGAVETPLEERPIDAFKRFYADTASFGSRAAIECGMSFFGYERLLFASDSPFDPEQGPGYIRETLAAIAAMDLTSVQREAMLSGNARRLLRLPVATTV